MVTTESRVERDFIGLLEVPKDVYYGVQTLRATENFPITGYRIHEELIRSMALVKKAAALTNMEMGNLDHLFGQAIVEAADEIIEGKWYEQFIVDPIQGGAGTSFNMNTNEVIANRAIELLGGNLGDYSLLSPNSHVNMAQSTNDSFPTAVHIAVLSLISTLLKVMEDMRTAFKQKSAEFEGILKIGRTHLQDAVPIRFGQEFEAYQRVIERDIVRIQKTRNHLYEVNMGATAVGTGLNANEGYIKRVVELLALMSNFPLVNAEHLVDATQNTDAYTEVSSALKICMINMSKISNDLRLMASGPRAGLNEIRLPARQPGSSIMPGKVNPVMCEVVNQVAFQVIGNDHTISLASEAGQLELNVMEPVLVFNLLQSLTIMAQAFKVFTIYGVEGIEVNEDVCKNYVDESVGIITALNPHLGYETSTKIAREAITSKRSVRELCLEHRVLTQAELDVILNPFEMTHPKVDNSVLMKRENRS